MDEILRKLSIYNTILVVPFNCCNLSIDEDAEVICISDDAILYSDSRRCIFKNDYYYNVCENSDDYFIINDLLEVDGYLFNSRAHKITVATTEDIHEYSASRYNYTYKLSNILSELVEKYSGKYMLCLVQDITDFISFNYKGVKYYKSTDSELFKIKMPYFIYNGVDKRMWKKCKIMLNNNFVARYSPN